MRRLPVHSGGHGLHDVQEVPKDVADGEDHAGVLPRRRSGRRTAERRGGGARAAESPQPEPESRKGGLDLIFKESGDDTDLFCCRPRLFWTSSKVTTDPLLLCSCCLGWPPASTRIRWIPKTLSSFAPVTPALLLAASLVDFTLTSSAILPDFSAESAMSPSSVSGSLLLLRDAVDFHLRPRSGFVSFELN